MKFTDRFIKFPTKSYNTEDFDQTGVKDWYETNTYIDPNEIYMFERGTEEGTTSVFLKEGMNLRIYLSLKEFADKINAHNDRN